MDKRKPRKSEPTLDGGEPRAPADQWGLDREDLRRHARRMQDAKAVGPLGRFFRFAAIALLVAGAFAAYWNFETLKELRFDLSRVTGAFEDAADEIEDARRGGEPGTEVIGDTSIAGVNMPTSIGGEPPAAEQPASEPPANGPAAAPNGARAATDAAPGAPPAVDAAADAPPVADAALGAAPEPAVQQESARQAPPEPEVPAGPEMFGFGLHVMNVSEADASAAVLALRDGGRRGVAFITWWTTDGTATAGGDFARLEPRVERFGAGEQNRTLYVPIIGDRTVEGPENFHVHMAVGDSGKAENPVAQIEIVIDDDD
jgi:hypothetical protein